MQDKNVESGGKRRSNTQRSEEMRARLMASARAIFVEKGFAGAGTPEIVKAAKVTRGALYHHFTDKTDLFRAVVMAETDQLAVDINAMTDTIKNPEEALLIGTKAYFASMKAPGRCQLLLVDGPAALGLAEMSVLHEAGGRSTLIAGISNAHPVWPADQIDAFAVVLSAAYDRAAFAISEGAAEEPFVKAMMALVLTTLKV